MMDRFLLVIVCWSWSWLGGPLLPFGVTDQPQLWVARVAITKQRVLLSPLLTFLADTLWAISAAKDLLCISSSSSSATLDTTNFMKPASRGRIGNRVSKTALAARVGALTGAGGPREI